MSQQVNTLSPSKAIFKLKEAGYPPEELNIPRNIHVFLTSIPGSLDLKIVPRRYIKHSTESLPQYSSKFPQESPIQFPQESWNPSPQAVSLSPVDSGSLSLAEHERVPRLYSKVISLPGYNWVILSQKPRKDRSRQSLLIPSEVY